MFLDLSKNNLTDIGLKSLTYILGVSYGKNSISKKVIHLNLSFNGITSNGF